MNEPLVIYIAGYGRSGSSALSRALSQESGLLSAGELGRFSSYLRDGGLCACGELVSNCPVWGNAATGSIEELMRSAREARFEIVVDSSKTAYKDFHRPLLYRLKGYRVVLIHLRRPLGGVLQSTKKGTNKDLEAGRMTSRSFNQTRTVMGYLFAHAAAFLSRAVCNKYLVIDQREMLGGVAEIAEKIVKSSRDVGRRANVARDPKQQTHGMHEIAGNRLLRKKNDDR